MQTTPQKRGRPRKFGSKEEKARQDVLAKRARRHLQRTAAHCDVRFQVYQTPASSATEKEPAGRLDVLADAAQLVSRMTPPRGDSVSTELEGNENTSDEGCLQSAEYASSIGRMAPFGEEARYMASCVTRCKATSNVLGRRGQFIRVLSAPYRHVEMST